MDKEKNTRSILKQFTVDDFLASASTHEDPKKKAQVIKFIPKKNKAELAREKAIEKIIRFAERLEG